MTTVLVTGGNGFIGRATCAELRAQGHTPLVFDRHFHGKDLILGDIRDRTQVTDAAAHADAIIHLAGVLGTQETIANPYPAAETNVLGGLNVLHAARQYDLPLVNIAVGNYWMDNPYSITKNTVERFCRMYRDEHNQTVAIVRAMNAYGPTQLPAFPYGPGKVRKIMPAFVCRALTTTPIEIYGDGHQIMDCVHVKDVARSLVAALGATGEWESGTGRATSVKQIAECVIEAVGEGELKFSPMRPGEPPNSTVLADVGKCIVPAAIRLEDGVKETVEWFREHWLPTYA